MRIIRGRLKGRKLACPRGTIVRPTADRLREALFQVLESNYALDWHGLGILDLFAGAGTLGIEALSRGAQWALFVERDRRAAAVIEKNLRFCRLSQGARVLRCDVLRFLNQRDLHGSLQPVSMIFADPPYGRGLSHVVLSILADRCIFMAGAGQIVVEEEKGVELASAYTGRCMEIHLDQKRCYGDSALFFYTARGRR